MKTLRRPGVQDDATTLRAACGVVLIVMSVSGCRTVQAPVVETQPTWDVSRSEILQWRADDPAFNQDRALEASGLAVAKDTVYVLSEKYARLLVIDDGPAMEARVIRLQVPRHSELEGIAVRSSVAYLCDEAHATVHEVDLSDIDRGWGLPSRRLQLQGLSVRGGKIGFEGVAASPDGRFLYLLLERSSLPGGGCVSKVFRMRLSDDVLKAEGKPMLIALEDCTWRLTDLELWHGRLLALKSKFPGNRYEVIVIDPDRKTWERVLDLTEPLRSVTKDGWGNNVEGIAVAADGSLYLVADNAVTGVIDDPEPPLTDELTLLMRIPLAGSESPGSLAGDGSTTAVQ
jgi:uncharacterized protein YjiK